MVLNGFVCLKLFTNGKFRKSNMIKTSLEPTLPNRGYSFMLGSPNQRANQIRRSYKNEEFDWLFEFVPHAPHVTCCEVFIFFYGEKLC